MSGGSRGAIALGDVPGAFVPAPIASIPTGLQPYAVALADLDGNGVLDLLVANENDSTVSVFLGNAQ